MASVLLIAQHLGGELNSSTSKAMACAKAIGDVTVAVFAESGQAVADAAATLEGASKVVLVDRAENAEPVAAILAPQIAKLAQDLGVSHVVGPNTTFGKDLMPRVAALLDSVMVTDIMSVEGPYSFQRPIYAGNAIVSVDAPQDGILVGSARTASFKAVGEQSACPVEAVTVDAELPTHTRFVKREGAGGDRPDLQSAPKVVSGGRGVGSEENFEIIYRMADKIGAAVGASRAAVDSGFCANDMQVGQTGKVIAPELYRCFGISGAIQHLAGIKDAGCIVAVNKDEEASIFEVADIGLVGDLFEVIPELESKL